MPITRTSQTRDRLSILRPEAGAGGDPESGAETLASAVRRGLTHEPKWLPCRFLYDATGSELFEQICEQPEYYPTRTEDAILRDQAGEMVAGWDEAPVMIELGSGSSTKTRRLIEAALDAYDRLHYVPVDVSETILEESARSLVDDYPALNVTGIVSDYHTALRAVRRRFPGPKLVVFLGSSLGNFDDEDAVALLRHLSEALGPEDRLLIGLDQVKDAATLEAAYDDAAGVTARFSKNILTRINRELDADFDPDRFAYQARFVPERHRVEMRLISDREQDVAIPGAGLRVRFAAGESIHVENSHKYTPGLLRDLASRSGFVEEGSWSDPDRYFRVQRWRPRV
ncbi:L-histidine N(alpha)-methyltransferase [Tautonia plasticadhaerens]|uniref:Histidine-specific methyltransferase EgtD n=1 Tax=Tautonia plasticadhaerens TaxID=2527974 RepID=A0A518HBM9_9BACT|nr:L-histidine N(alpha)-methyltransferase [Tautonia plasticadhaerens]QDV38268.1 Histidine-specific methyltransferase EgtD [Tautonia plasticadhaerens]